MSTPIRRALPALTAALGLSHSAAAQTVDLADVSLYAGGTLTIDGPSTIAGGAIVARGDINQLAGRLSSESIFGESDFNGGLVEDTGPIFLNGDITDFSGGIFGGNVGSLTSATGNIEIVSNATLSGDVTAAGNVSQDFAFSEINANVLAGGDVSIGGFVNGTVTHGGDLSFGIFSNPANISGGSTPGGPVSPTPFVAPALPASTASVAGSNDINLSSFENITLSPGAYGTLNFDSSNTVSLSAGTYIFQDIVSERSLNELAFDTTGGAIEIFIAEPDAGFNLVQSINGEKLFGVGTPDPTLAADITLEVADSFTLGSDFYGTIFAPNGDVILDTFADLTGRVLAGGNVVLNNSDILAVPEPATAALLAVGGLMLTRRRGR